MNDKGKEWNKGYAVGLIMAIIIIIVSSFIIFVVGDKAIVPSDEPYNCNCGEWVDPVEGKTYCGLRENSWDIDKELWEGYIRYVKGEIE